MAAGAGQQPGPGIFSAPAGYRIGKWELRELIGAGGWSAVYRATSPVTGGMTEAAVKLIGGGPTTLWQRSRDYDMARNEAATAAALGPDHAVFVHEVLAVADPRFPGLDGAAAVVMSLAATSAKALLTNETLEGPIADADRILEDVLAVLSRLHSLGRVHGDLKPGSILLVADGSVRLADFGFSAVADGTRGYQADPHHTRDHVAPEYLTDAIRRSAGGGLIRPSLDIWSFGVTAHELLAGRHPFPGATPDARALAAMNYAMGREPLRLSADLALAWSSVITDCLAPDHERRALQTAGALLERVQAINAGPTGVPLSKRRWRKPGWASRRSSGG